MTIRLNAVRTACLCGVAAIGLTGLSAPAAAQSLEELRRQVEILSQRIEQLENQQRAAQTAPAPAPASAPSATAGTEGVVESGNDSIRLTLSGQVNRGVLFADNGSDSEVFHVDNDNSSTRFRFVGEGDLNDDITVGSQIELQFESNSTGDISFNQSDAADAEISERKLELYFNSDRFGRVWIGQGSTASDGTSEVDFSGTTVVAYSSVSDMAGGLEFQNGTSIGDAFSNFDGLGRDDRLRYDTPNFSGFTVSASSVESDDWDGAVRFSGEIAGVRTAAAIGYAESNTFSQINGSASVLLQSGLSFTAAAGTRDLDDRGGDDPLFYYGKIGQNLDLFDIGQTALSVDFAKTDDLDADGDEFTSYGAFVVQNLDPVATELYLGVRNHALEVSGSSDPDDLIAVLAGARIKF